MKVIRNIPQSDWLNLIGRSHQTSMFVLPEWLALYKDDLDIMAVQAANGELIAGLVTTLSTEPLPYIMYAGMLLTRREMPIPAGLLLEAAEQPRVPLHVTNSPAGIDIRPFQWRLGRVGAMWADTVRYTFFYDERNARPFDDLAPSTNEREIPASDEALRRLDEVVGRGDIERLIGLESTKLYENDEGEIVLWGTDLQDRGYNIAGTSKCSGLVVQLAKKCRAGADLYGCNSETMNRKKRVYGAKLRTYYRMDLIQR